VGTGNPELLKYHMSGYWSGRINQSDRIIEKYEDKVDITEVSAIGLCGDK
jgi:toxin YoeB